MRFASIASGSSGNCIYTGSETTHILIDAGISNRRIEEGLKALELKPEDLNGILITHEHSDHIQGLNTFLKKHPIPVYGTAKTLEEIRRTLKDSCPEEYFIPLQPDISVEVGDFSIIPFSISHDAADPVGYRLESGGKSTAVATDMGCWNDYIRQHLTGLDSLLLESNHDVHMLETGPYPYYLKRRILGDQGHLSNENAGRLLSQVLHGGLKHILLGHISKENNYPELAYEAVRLEINLAENGFHASDFDIRVAGRNEMSEIYQF